ncbi:FAD-dependent oxidoreductase [Raoultibacter timonensis]|uniref:FAD-binding dehydrogenase n=1 Tax=Raoultibacter timonensis TaxID=1907662 RepID=A0ABN6MEJ3_9ACTN|nr:FAD-dependent oxidoreductase [Raoultibacter timonensis]BDE95495.1 FAD-binding dehydrogenase [Raoultibacter timonensis]BDF50099.1 FAD-binding dehydrogenase [Raoultibacter timonensis]
MAIMKSGISRRAFLGLGATAAVAAGAGLAGCSPASNTSGTAQAEQGSAAESSWKTPPAEITDFAKEYDCDVVVCGHGFAGITACRELAEEGYKVILVEKQPEDTYAAVGNEFAALNASILKERGVPEIDPVEFFQNWMTVTGNYPNQELVMKFAQHSGENSDWYLSELSEEDFATMTTAFFPKTAHQLDNIGPIKFWPSVCSFYGDCNQTKIHEYNRAVAQDKGAEFLFGTEALYVIMDNGQVAGLAAKNADGNLKLNAKAVVIACGGFGGNPEMMADLMPDMYHALVGDEQLTSMSANDGRGVQMAYWAGAHLETCPIPGMNMKGLSLPGKMNCLPQSVWIDENGKRFCNEYYATSEQRGLATVYKSRKTKFAVCDANFPEYRQYTIPQHAGFTATEENIASLQESLDKAYAIFKGTYEEPEKEEGEGGGMGPVTTIDFIADDTLEGLAGQLGLTGEAATNFVETINNYNAYCEAGADQEFGRDKAVLFPVKEPPFFACTFDPVLGETMVTCGGIITDGEQNALDENFEPIPGLYVSGNDCGRRFGYEYITPIPGCSLGMAITLGRECGKSVGAYLG